jgi:hypothetical protein
MSQHNGFDDIVAAAKLIHWDDAYSELNANDAPIPIAMKRKFVEDNVAVIQRVRNDLEDPSAIPNLKMGEYAPFGSLREFARLLARQEEVQLADGKRFDAIETMQVGCELAQRMQHYSIINALVASGIERIVSRPMETAISTLSEPEAARLFEILNKNTRFAPDFVEIFVGSANEEKEMVEHPAEFIESDPIGKMFLGDKTDEIRKQEQNRTEKERAEIGTTIDWERAEALRFAVIAPVPAWRRVLPSVPRPELRHDLAGLLQSDFEMQWNYLQDYDRNVARRRVFAVRAAIAVYKWHNSVLPKDLSNLNEPNLITNPITGKPFQYWLTKDSYELSFTENPAEEEPENRGVSRRPRWGTIPTGG